MIWLLQTRYFQSFSFKLIVYDLKIFLSFNHQSFWNKFHFDITSVLNLKFSRIEISVLPYLMLLYIVIFQMSLADHVIHSKIHIQQNKYKVAVQKKFRAGSFKECNIMYDKIEKRNCERNYYIFRKRVFLFLHP